jgi:hypothetical protein
MGASLALVGPNESIVFLSKKRGALTSGRCVVGTDVRGTYGVYTEAKTVSFGSFFSLF